MRRTLALALVASAAAVSFAQEVKFEKYQLQNGMTVILHEDHSLPVVAINTWYHVGAKDEPPGRSGFAHLFEHLMFMGTQRVPGNQFDVIMETGGGANNASTSFDRTNYYSSGPASLLPTLLWLDADRLEDLGRTMTQEKLDKQRDVVRNERRQSIENQPYGKAELMITEIMFPQGHPYHFEVIGTHQDLENASVIDVTDFFATFYVPNNASLVVAGDFRSAEVKPLIEGLFGTIPRGAEPMHKTVPSVALPSQQRLVTMDRVQAPKVCFVYHSPASYAAGDAECDLIAAVLAQGKSSRLYKRLVIDDKIAVDVSSYQSSAMLQSNFRVDVTAAPGVSLDTIEKVVDEELDRLIASGPTAEELEQKKTSVELAKVSGLQSLLAKADKMNEYEYFFGNPDGFKADLDRYRNATPASIKEWAGKVLTKDKRLVARILPNEPERAASARDQRPSDGAVQPFSPPPPETFTVAGVPVQLWNRPDLPLVSVQVLFTPGGPLDDPASAGRSTLAAQMLSEGAAGMSAEQFSDAVQALGATFGSGTDVESAAVSMTVLKRNFDKAADLMVKALRQPNMKAQDWERVHRLHLEDLKQQDDQPTAVAAKVGQRLLYGDSSPYAWPVDGTKATVTPLTLEQIDARRKELFAPGHATILVAGDLTRAEAEKTFGALLAGWTGGAARAKAGAIVPPAPARPGLRVALVHREGAEQTVVRFFAPGVAAGDGNRVPLRLMNTILGGSFTSRLNQNLREDKAYTYGARSSFSMRPSGGYFSAGANVKSDVTGPSLAEFFREFGRLAKGDVLPEEVTKASETLRTDTVQAFEGIGGVVGAASELVENGLPFETIAKDMKAMQAVNAAALNDVAKTAIRLDEGVLVLVGDRAVVMEQIKDLKLPAVVEYDAAGAAVKQ